MTTFMKQISSQIRRIREEQGLTQTMLAEKSGVNYRYIGFIEQGRISTTIKTIERIAKALGIEMCELCTKAKIKRKKRKTPNAKEQAIEQIAKQLRKSSPKKIKTYEKILRLLK